MFTCDISIADSCNFSTACAETLSKHEHGHLE